MLRIELQVVDARLIVTKYTLSDQYKGFTLNIKPRKRYYLLNNFRTNMTIQQYQIYYRRKYQFSDCQDGHITTRKYFGKGGEFYEVQGIDAFNNKNVGFGCQKPRYLTTISTAQTLTEEKRIMPSFMFVSDKRWLNESVHFEIRWSVDSQTGALKPQTGKTITLHFDIFEDE